MACNNNKIDSFIFLDDEDFEVPTVRPSSGALPSDKWKGEDEEDDIKVTRQ